MVKDEPTAFGHLLGRNVAAEVEQDLENVSGRQPAAALGQVHRQVQKSPVPGKVEVDPVRDKSFDLAWVEK